MKDFATFLAMDKVLIVAFIIFAVSLITVILYVESAHIRSRIAKCLYVMTAKLQEWTALLRDDEPFDAEWMDATKWRQSRQR